MDRSDLPGRIVLTVGVAMSTVGGRAADHPVAELTPCITTFTVGGHRVAFGHLGSLGCI